MALLDAQRGQRLETVGADTQRCRRTQDVLPHRDAMVGRRVDLVGEFARETEPHHLERYAVVFDLEASHVRQGRRRDIVSGQCEFQRLARMRTSDRHARVLVGDGHRLHAQIRPRGLQQELDMRHHLGRLRGGGGQEPAHVAQTRAGAVVQHGGVVVQHHAVTGFADRKARKDVYVDAIKKLPHVGALQFDLAEGRDVGDADCAAHEAHLLDVGACGGIARPTVVPRAQPRAGLGEDRTICGVPVVHR